MIDIAKLQTHVGWLTKGLYALAAASAVVVGWMVLYLYIPMRDLSQNVAVQTTTLGYMKDDLTEIKGGVKDINTRMNNNSDNAARSARSEPDARISGSARKP